MSFYCTLNITLTVRFPFLCSATGPRNWGLDYTFNRNYQDEFAILKSHIRGKLREAWNELSSSGSFKAEIDRWLGRASDEKDHYLPYRGMMHFSDFVCTRSAGTECIPTHRIRIEKITGTACEGALISAEIPFKSGMDIQWSGTITYPAANRAEGEHIRDQVLTGLRWVTALGAEKGVGFGRLVAVMCDGFSMDESVAKIVCPNAISSQTGLAITLAEPVMAGGVRMKDNYLETQKILSGTLIKGSLAQCIRRRVGLSPNSPIEPCDALKKAGLPLIGKYFEYIRFTHAYPTQKNDIRPVVPPLSLVKAGELSDVALSDAPVVQKKKDGKPMAPAFRVDWKWADIDNVDKAHGWAEPKILAVTRTAIDPLTRRAREEMLYTFEYLCPTDEDDKEIRWISNMRLPKTQPPDERQQLASEMGFVLENWLDYIGKREGKIEKVELINGGASPAVPMQNVPIRDNYTIVTLQSDALMLDPWHIADGGENSLFEAYSQFWKEISSDAYALVRFFATQKVLGGYLGRRFRVEGKYYPFFLTEAGSVFTLEVRDGKKAEKCCESWTKFGLTVPEWAISPDRYGKSEGRGLDWRKSPFTQENGYGEVALNLDIHWKNPGGNDDGTE